MGSYPVASCRGKTRVFGGGIPVFDFNDGLASFTPKMAKREGTVFSGSPIVQGFYDDDTKNGDVLSFSVSSTISSGFKETFDWDQGSIVFFITPEWNGNDGNINEIYRLEGNRFRLERLGSTLRIWYNISVKASINISAWTAGTTYCVVIRWDTKNTLDGTNYTCISVNDVHNFGGNSITSFIDTGQFYICIAENNKVGNSLVEGFTIYRRSLFDGTYGIDVGNGDEIAQVYNAGSGNDIAEITGSEDIVFCCPTDSEQEEIVSGVGEAYSFPNSSNEVTPVDGFMTNGVAWANYSAELTPASGALLAISEKIFGWGYKFTANSVDEGYYIDVSVSAGETKRVRFVSHSDGNSQPSLIVYDQTNGALITRSDGTTLSTRTTPNILSANYTVPVGCNTVRLKMVDKLGAGIVYCHQIVQLPTDSSYSVGDFSGVFGNGNISNALLQKGTGVGVNPYAVARVTALPPLLLTSILLDDVSLTVTPSSLANSEEEGGIRVDGLDRLTQPTTELKSKAGKYRANFIPRHAIDDVNNFGKSDEYFFIHYEDANNYIFARREENLIRLSYNANAGGLQTATYNATGTWAEQVEKLIEVEYSAVGAILYIDGVAQITIVGAVVFSTDWTVNVFWGSDENYENQFDGVIKAP